MVGLRFEHQVVVGKRRFVLTALTQAHGDMVRRFDIGRLNLHDLPEYLLGLGDSVGRLEPQRMIERLLYGH
jgi:hypothetical protein